MSIDEFRALSPANPPDGMSGALIALLWDAQGNWQGAHEAAQADDRAPCAWVHAYLHRKEGDAGNAAYWYRRAGKPLPRVSLDAEWEQIAAALLGLPKES
jgi:hypothetical protein